VVASASRETRDASRSIGRFREPTAIDAIKMSRRLRWSQPGGQRAGQFNITHRTISSVLLRNSQDWEASMKPNRHVDSHVSSEPLFIVRDCRHFNFRFRLLSFPIVISIDRSEAASGYTIQTELGTNNVFEQRFNGRVTPLPFDCTDNPLNNQLESLKVG
jgi:hypothetical protein